MDKKHFLVAISSSPHSEYLIRWTYDLVVPLEARWTVLHVDSPDDKSAEGRDVLRKNLELARRLGAEIGTMTSEDVAATIVNYARVKGATQIIIGKSDPHRIFRLGFQPLLTQRIIRMSGPIDVLVLQEKDYSPKKTRRFKIDGSKMRFAAPLIGAATILLVTAFNLLVLQFLGYHGVSIIFLLSITALAFFLKRGSVLFATVLAALSWNFLFIPPLNTFTIGKAEDILMFLMFFVTAFVTGFLATRVRTNEKMLAQREGRMTFLYNFVQALSEKRTAEDMILSSLASIEHQFGGQCVIILGGDKDGLSESVRSVQEFKLPEDEREPAEWCYRNNRVCGRYASHYMDAMFHYMPLSTPDSVMGVFGIRLSYDKLWSQEQENFLFTLVQNMSLTLEREQLAQARQRSLVTAESERLGKILLNLVSHELRTPLTTIKGAVTALMEPSTAEDSQSRGELLDEMLLASEKLNTIVENLLSMSRLESRNLKLRRESVILEDMIGVVLDSMTRELANYPVEVTVQGDAGQLNLDFVLFVQVITNLLQNIVRHTPQGTQAWLMAFTQGRDLHIRICDAGPGVSLEQIPFIFEKFFRGSKTENREGFGLGLSICRGIVEAHGGVIAASPRPGGGLCIEIHVPGCVEPISGELS